MKRMLLTAATSSIFALAVPGLASAAAHHHSSCHHRAHHACVHSHHAQRARVMTFGAASTSTGSGTGTSNATGSTPTSATTPASSGETAGTVASLTGGVLTITLTDGSTVSGKVTEKTEIHCQAATPPAEGSDDDQQGDESSGGNGEDSSHGGPGMSSQGSDMSSGDGSGDAGTEQQSCTTAALIPGAVVREAELSVGSAGSVWDHVDLIH